MSEIDNLIKLTDKAIDRLTANGRNNEAKTSRILRKILTDAKR